MRQFKSDQSEEPWFHEYQTTHYVGPYLNAMQKARRKPITVSLLAAIVEPTALLSVVGEQVATTGHRKRSSTTKPNAGKGFLLCGHWVRETFTSSPTRTGGTAACRAVPWSLHCRTSRLHEL